MEIKGKIFHIQILNQWTAQIVIKKVIQKKMSPVALNVFGFWKDVAINKLKLKKNDIIQGNVVLKSKLWKDRYFTEVLLTNIELVTPKPKPIDDSLFKEEEPLNPLNPFL